MDENEQKQTKQNIFIIKTLLKDLIQQINKILKNNFKHMSGLENLLTTHYKQMKHIIRLVKNLKNLDLENNDRMLQFEEEKYFR